jgi:hypothetical protein
VRATPPGSSTADLSGQTISEEHTMSKKLSTLLALVLVLTGLVGAEAAHAEVADGWDYRSLSVNGAYQPLVGQFGGDEATDILWYAPGSAPDSLWIGRAGERGAAAFTRVNLTINGTYTPIVGDFFGDDYTDIIWYAPGRAGDFAWVSDEVPGYFTTKPLTINGTYKVNVLQDYSGTNRKDDILWYAPGAGKDFVWHLADTGSGTYSTVNLSINGTFQRIVGDWNADGRDDLVLYRPGTAADYRWASKSDGSFAQSSLTINGTYEPATVYQPDGDGILWWGDGATREAYWVRNGATFRSVGVPAVPPIGSVTTWGLGSVIVTVPNDVDGAFSGDQFAGDWFGLAGESHDKTTQKPLVGDYDGDGYLDIVWYGSGSTSDELWYVDDTMAGRSSSDGAVARGLAPSGRLPVER